MSDKPKRTPMSKDANRLTAKKIGALLRKRAVGVHHDGHGLLLQIQLGSKGKATASWLLRYQRNHRNHQYGLGALHTVTLKDARERARLARLQLQDGVDPIDARRDRRIQEQVEAAKRVTFKQAAEQFIAANEEGWTNAVHRSQWRTTLAAYVYPHIGDLPVSVIDQALVLKCLTPIWKDKTATASRIRSRIENVLDFAKANGWREGDNPAVSAVLKHVLPAGKTAKAHHAAMPYQDVPAFLGELRGQEGVIARALEFAILTAVRTGEALGATWAEIDLAEKVWVIPAERMKMDEEHRIPLSDRVVEILSALPREAGNPYVFVAARRANHPPHGRALFKLLHEMRSDQAVTVHGFRSSFTNWAHERASTDNFTIEMALAHKVGNAVTQAYLRSTLFEKRRKLMSDWSAFCSGETGTVVQFPKMKEA